MKRLPAWFSVLLLVVVTILHGCDQPAARPPAANVPAPPAVPIPPPTPPAVPVPPPSVAQTPPSSPNVAQTPPNTEAVKADVGVGQKGRSLDGYQGAVVTPAKAYFAVREKAIFQIQIPHAMQLFKAESGAGPQSHTEFMDKIIKANGIQLPELPPGQIFEYRPETEELMVIKPAK